MVFYIVLSVVTVMGIFILFYHNFSKQLAFSSFYHVNREKLRNLTEIIIDSAFSNLQTSTRDPHNELTKKIIDQMRTPGISNTAFALTAPLFEANRSALLNGASLNYTLTGKIFDKRIQTPQNQKYHDGEGLGTFEIFVDASLETPSGKVLARCLRRRHFDIKSACLVSNFIKRENYYAMTFPLDFTLLVRNGLREFQEGYRGQNFNPGQKLIIEDQSSIQADKRGLVYFGQADQNDESKRVYFNTSNNGGGSDAILPQMPVENFAIDQSECIKFIPEIDVDGIEKVSGIKGIFTFKSFPAARTSGTPDPSEKEARNILSAIPGNPGKIVEQMPAGIDFAGPKDKAYLDSLLRGAVTQKWLYVVHFALDASTATAEGKPIPADKQQILEETANFVCYSPEASRFKDDPSAESQKRREAYQRLEELAGRVNPPLPLYSDMVEDYLFYQGQQMQKTEVNETFKAPPKFFGRNSSPLGDLTMTGGEGFRPFRHYTLCSARYFYASELEKNGIYDRKNGILNLRGVVSVELDHVSFNPPTGRDHIIIKGSGAILAPNGFTINCGLKRENPDKDLCILFTRKGSIRIGTEARIEASLLAFNDSNTGSIVPSKPMNVFGAVGVDQLYLGRFPSAPGKIEYDPRLKAGSDNDEIFALTVSPWVRYEDIAFSKE
ncbi:MAG: hypothetical protein PHD82_08145 [Candidatus Riflebacteria bacterium]|nr:hypothetical protein [Candidatus Riflebacteria bacterium]